MPRVHPEEGQRTQDAMRRAAPTQPQQRSSPRTGGQERVRGVLIDDGLEGDLEQYPGQQQERLQEQQGPAQGPAADDEVQIVDPNGDEVRNWK